MHLCCGPVNRGFGVLGDRLFMTTIDAHLLSLDMKTGAVIYDVKLEDYNIGYSATVAPLVVKDKVIIGIAGAEYGIRGFIEAFDAADRQEALAIQHGGRARRSSAATPGRRATRIYAVAAPSGSPAPTIPKQNLLFFGTGNPGPDYYSGNREGDNLFTASIVALDVDTGKLKWHYQFTPHDVHDWDATQVPGPRRPAPSTASRARS